MPERFNFVVFLERPALLAPLAAFQVIERLFEEHLGEPLTTAQLDLQTGNEASLSNIPATILPQDLFYVHYATVTEPSVPGPVILLRCPPNCSVVTISLENTSIEADPEEIVHFCTNLYLTFRPFSEHCVVTAGAEVGIDAYSVAEALHTFVASDSLSQWAGGSNDAADFLLSTGQFLTEIETPEFVLMRRRAYSDSV